MRITPLEPAAAVRVAQRARRVDLAEFETTQGPAADPAAWGRVLARDAIAGGIAWSGAEPVAAIGVVPVVPGIGDAVMMATPAWPLVARATTHWVQLELIPTLLRAGYRRVEARVRADRAPAVRWLIRYFGGRLEAELPDIGRNGERFLQVAWCRSSFVVNGARR